MPAGPWDSGFALLTQAASKSMLWGGIAVGLSSVKGPPRRAALHGLAAVAVASAVVNIVGKQLLPRARPQQASLPLYRFLNPQPTSSSLPSGHSASAVAFATGVGFVSPRLGVALAPVAAAVAYSRVHTGAHWPSDVVLGSALGAGAALVTRSWWPRQEAAPEPHCEAAEAPALDGGRGLAVVVNPLSGSGGTETDELRDHLPNALFHLLGKDDDVDEVCRKLAGREGIRALAVCGGDGTVGAVAGVCADLGLPLAVLPGGTFNHFARDIGASGVESVAAAVSSGRALRCDLARVRAERGAREAPEVRELAMVNTASIGVYPNLVRRRDALQHRLPGLGKHPAALLAALVTFAVSTPTRLLLDGRSREIWTLFIGRGRYWPRDLAPLERPILDDGVLDLRAISADPRFARLRLLAAIVTGTTERSRDLETWEARRVDVEATDGDLVLAVDGEVLAGVRRVTLTVDPAALTVYSPRVAEDSGRE
ncbi:bifunctional phosphatase PAP2/diacylglycerol kinase family protein [Sinomonas gamaensis]|uniref:bifunctional phosphatase PAP2/diacylglycerol kinase family protein n=1 Tax=Sinomonas gamaensis TaxID=2565624 RepID=UPI003083FB54